MDKKSHFELKHCLKNGLSPQVGEVSREKWELSVSVVLTSLPPRTPFPSGGSVAGARRPTERQLRPKRGPVSLSDSSRYSRSPGRPFLGKLFIPAPLPIGNRSRDSLRTALKGMKSEGKRGPRSNRIRWTRLDRGSRARIHRCRDGCFCDPLPIGLYKRVQ